MKHAKQWITQHDIDRARKTIRPVFGPLGETVLRRTYARPKPDGTLEDWYEVCARVVNGNLNLVDERFIEPDEPKKLYEAMVKMEILPAGRHLWATGTNRVYINNCFVADFSEDFAEHFRYTFMRLMEGEGVGANYSDLFINSNPRHPEGHWVPSCHVEVRFVCRPDHPDIDNPTLIKPDWQDELPFHTMREAQTIDKYADIRGYMEEVQIEDSREGWADAMTRLLHAHFNGHDTVCIFDFSKIREFGAPLKTFGGKASGPAALMLMLYRINRLLNSKVGQRLTSLDMMLIDHYIAQAVVAGGTRRSARMAMKRWRDPDIFDFIHCKRDGYSHWTTNISVVVDDEFFRAVQEGDIHAQTVLDAVVEGMLTNGEPGLINATMCEKGEAPGATFYSTNPCVVGDTLILTTEGLREAGDLVGKPFTAITPQGEMPVSGFFVVGTKPTVKLVLENGAQLVCTPDHRVMEETGTWRNVQDLQPGDVLLMGPGSACSEHLRTEIHNLNSLVTERAVEGTGKVYYLYYGDPQEARRTLHRFLSCGVPARLRRGIGGWYVHLDAKTVEYLRSISRSKNPTRRIRELFGEQLRVRVERIEPAGEQPVYDCQVPGYHCYLSNGLISHNCGEIPMMRYPDLGAYDVCCLGHVNLVGNAQVLECFRLMTRFLLRATFSEQGDKLTIRNIERNRRIGVGFLGFHEWLIQHGMRYSEASHSEKVRRMLRRFYRTVREEARRYAYQLRIVEPIKVTTVAPTGTVHKLPGVSSGIEPIYSRYFLNIVRCNKPDIRCGFANRANILAKACAEGSHTKVRGRRHEGEETSLSQAEPANKCMSHHRRAPSVSRVAGGKYHSRPADTSSVECGKG